MVILLQIFPWLIVFNPKDEIVKEKADVIVEKKIKRLN
jgi:hypothetical protein